MRIKKILFYINTLNRGGAERVMANLSFQFAEAGYNTVFVTSYEVKNEYTLHKKTKRLVLENKEEKQSRIMRNISRIIKLRKICKKEMPDVLVAFMAEPNFRSIIATVGLSTKTVVSVRNDPNKEYAGNLLHFVGKYILPFADGCVFQTEMAKSWFPKKLQNKSTIIYNAVHEKFYTTKRTPEDELIVTCGRLQPQKNQKLLIEAFSEVYKKYPTAKIKIYGEGKCEDEIRQYINDLNLLDRISLEGKTEDVPCVLAKADIFVLTSDYEGMPNALMEAMAMGIPVIATDCPCGGPKMLIEDGKNGLIIPVGDKLALKNALEVILNDKKLKQILGEQAKVSSYHYTSDKIFHEWEQYLTRIIK